MTATEVPDDLKPFPGEPVSDTLRRLKMGRERRKYELEAIGDLERVLMGQIRSERQKVVEANIEVFLQLVTEHSSKKGCADNRQTVSGECPRCLLLRFKSKGYFDSDVFVKIDISTVND